MAKRGTCAGLERQKYSSDHSSLRVAMVSCGDGQIQRCLVSPSYPFPLIFKHVFPIFKNLKLDLMSPPHTTLFSFMLCPFLPTPQPSATGFCHILPPKTPLTVFLPVLILSGFSLLLQANGALQYLSRFLLWVLYLHIQWPHTTWMIDTYNSACPQRNSYFPSKTICPYSSMNNIICHSGVQARNLVWKVPTFFPLTATFLVQVFFISCLEYNDSHAFRSKVSIK